MKIIKLIKKKIEHFLIKTSQFYSIKFFSLLTCTKCLFYSVYCVTTIHRQIGAFNFWNKYVKTFKIKNKTSKINWFLCVH